MRDLASPDKSGSHAFRIGNHMSRCQTHLGLQEPITFKRQGKSAHAGHDAQSRRGLKANASGSLRRLTDLNALRDSIKSQSPSARRLCVNGNAE